MSIEDRFVGLVQKYSGGLIRDRATSRLTLVILSIAIIIFSGWIASRAATPPPVDEAAAARAMMPPPPVSERRHGSDF